ncbi:putative disease resistance protein RGA3 [Elaeis guineensis]|uniref:putative disease resistance protein RGA3 n=1 Tax=Elaeis guineensis var. tenera TaxID=51953 RepID=UPI003C6D68ED
MPHDLLFSLSGERSILLWQSEKMAMILEAFVGKLLDKLSEFIWGEISITRDVQDELKQLQRRIERLSGYLESAEQKRHENRTINNWVVELKDVMYDADDIIERCMIEGRILLENHPSTLAVRDTSSSFYSPGFLQFKHEIGKKIKELNDRLKEINKDRSKLPALKYSAQEGRVNTRQTFPSVIKSDIVGPKIEEATQSLVELLIKDANKKYRVLGIVGMGGIGKTTLASNIYNNKIIKENFPIRVWVCISQDFSETKMLKEIIRGGGGNYGKAETKAELVTCLSFVLSKRFFIVLDDVWEKDVWEDLLRYAVENATSTGRIVITTRDRNVAGSIVTEGAEIHHVDKMDDHSGWKLLCKIVFGDNDDEEEEISSLQEIGVKIVKKCGGLPLAIKTIGGVLRSKERSNVEWNKILKSDAWSMSQLQEQLPRALFLSYEYLPSDLKQCFLYCSLFPEDFTMDRGELIRYWVAEGFVKRAEGDTIMEDLAEDFYRELIGRNLLQPCDKYGRLSDVAGNYCKMHDLLRSLAHFLMRDESIFLGDHEQSPNTNPLSKLRRLSMVNTGEILEVPDVMKQQKCLRTLLVWRSLKLPMVENELFESSTFLRVMNLSGTRLESLHSIGDLLHLRYLNVSGTDIEELPESIGCLVNLEVLNLSGCGYLHTLPKAITKLCNLRCLCIEETPLTHVPKGIGKLKHLNHLQGFVIGHDDRRDDEGCDLKELQSLSRLRFLEINNLKRAQPSGALVLANSRSLRTLILMGEAMESPSNDEEEAMAIQSNEEEEAISIQRNDKIYNELSPQSTHLQKLKIYDFIGTGFLGWMMSSPLSASFPNLTSIKLCNCISFPQLPPLGLLPQLKSLCIWRMRAIKTIGPEFLGPRASSAATSFPKLEQLKFEEMTNWEEWSFGMVEGVGEERRGAPKLLPCLTKLELFNCPKLRALPPLGLLPQLTFLAIGAGAIKTIGPEFLGPRASSAATSFPNLEGLYFKEMSNWEEWSFGMVEELGEERRGAPKLLPRLTKLGLFNCPKLRALPEGLRHTTNLQELNIYGADNVKEINNLPSLKSLRIAKRPRLEHVENLDKLQYLRVDLHSYFKETSTTDADGRTEHLPQCTSHWLLELLQNAPDAMQNLKEFKLRCSLPLLKTFLKDGPNWPIIQPIPQVKINGTFSSYIRCTKDPPSFETNVVESEESMDR